MRSQFIHLTFHALCIGTSSIYFEGHQSQTLPDNGNKTILRMRYELKSRKFYIEGVQGQRVTPPQAGNYRSKTKDRFLPIFKF